MASKEQAAFKAARERGLDELTAKLSVEAIGMLAITPYERERVWKTPRKAIDELLEAGLFEKHPNAKHVYRATARGGELVKYLARKHS